MSKVGGFNGTRTVVDIHATGTLTAVLATGPVVYVEVEESQVTAAGAVNTPQGFQFKLPNDDFTQLLEVIPGEVMTFGDRHGSHAGPGSGSILGNGPSYIIGIGATAATTLFEAQSLTATATSIVVTQYYS
jgi:hypothetical protein